MRERQSTRKLIGVMNIIIGLVNIPTIISNQILTRNAIRRNAIRRNAIRQNAIRRIAIRRDRIRRDRIRRDRIRRDRIRRDRIRRDRIRQNARTPDLIRVYRDGASRSGLVAAALHMIDMMKVEQIVDVFLVCRYVIANRPQAIVDLVSSRVIYINF